MKEKDKHICLKCMNEGYYKDSNGTVRFCELCLSKRGEEQNGEKDMRNM